MEAEPLLSAAGMALCTYLAALLLATPRGPGSGKPWLALVLAEAAVFFAQSLPFADGATNLAAGLLSCLDGLAALPALWLFCRAIFGEPCRRPWPHFLPAALAWGTGIALALLGGLGALSPADTIAGFDLADSIAWPAETLQLLVYGRRCLVLVAEPRRPGRRTDQARRLARWFLAAYALLYLWFWVVDGSEVLGAAFALPVPVWPAWVELALALPFLFGGGIAALARPELLHGEAPPAPEAQPADPRQPKYAGTPLAPGEAERLLERARAWLAQAPDLSDDAAGPRQLAEALGVSYHRLSRAANETGGLSLGDLVARARAERAASLLRERPELSVLEVAFEAGFNAKSSFNETFRRVYGTSPRDWRRQPLEPQ